MVGGLFGLSIAGVTANLRDLFAASDAGGDFLARLGGATSTALNEQLEQFEEQFEGLNLAWAGVTQALADSPTVDLVTLWGLDGYH